MRRIDARPGELVRIGDQECVVVHSTRDRVVILVAEFQEETDLRRASETLKRLIDTSIIGGYNTDNV